MAIRDIIVMGASAGGVSALQQVLATMPGDFPGAIFITMHMFNRADSPLAAILDKAGPLAVAPDRPCDRRRIASHSCS